MPDRMQVDPECMSLAIHVALGFRVAVCSATRRASPQLPSLHLYYSPYGMPKIQQAAFEYFSPGCLGLSGITISVYAACGSERGVDCPEDGCCLGRA